MNKQTIVVFQESKIPCFCMNEAHIKRLQQELPGAEIIWCHDMESYLNALPQADTVLSWTFKQEWFAIAPRLRRIATPAAGRDLFKISSVPDHIEIKNGSFHGPIMAETVIGMILAFNRGILTAYKHQLNGELWPNRPLFNSRLVFGSHAVILGFGRIGQHVGKMLKSFNVRITGVRRDASAAIPDWFEEGDTLKPVEDLPSALATADHLIVLLPSDTGTDNLLGKVEFDIMPQHAVVYNLGRGNSIDEQALADALRSGSIAGACLDVFAQEPLRESSPLADENLPGLLRMPHASAFCEQYLDRFLDEFIDWLKRRRL